MKIPMTDEQIAEEETLYRYARELEKKHKKPRLTSKELQEIFPEILLIAPIKIQELEAEIKELEEYCRKNKLFGESLENLWEQERRDEKMKDLRRKLMRFKVYVPSEPTSGLTEAEIQTASEFPITDLFDQGISRTRKVLCPIHEERTPSCVVYHNENRFWCYGCNQGGNPINLIMLRDEVDFRTAVRRLNGVS